MAAEVHLEVAMTRQTQQTELTKQLDWLAGLWCEFMHRAPMWPIHGQ
jgi:hypothetical protein